MKDIQWLVYNQKGGTGKTTIAFQLALMTESGLITNDSGNGFEWLGKERFLEVHQSRFPSLAKDTSVVWDMGGFLDNRIVGILPNIGCVVIPFRYDRKSLTKTQTIIKAIEPYSKNIVTVCNMLEKSKWEKEKEEIQNFLKYPVVYLRNSQGFEESDQKKRSLEEIAKETRLKARHYSDVVQSLYQIIQIGVQNA